MKTEHTRILNLNWPLRLALTIAGFALAVAPSHAQQLDPVKGPMSLQAPGPFYEGSKGGGTYGYSIKSDFARVQSFSYADGETLKGKSDWVTASAAERRCRGHWRRRTPANRGPHEPMRRRPMP